MEHPGKLLKARRRKRKMSQAELAALVHCDDSMISKYENGDRVPGLRTALRLEQVIGVKASLWLGAA